MPYIPYTDEERRSMLETLGLATLDELFSDIPAELRPHRFDLPSGLSEMEVRERMAGLAERNRTDLVTFLGAGFYDHDIPSAVGQLVGRGEFVTAYTPYQPEASQGTLQAIFEYQSVICRLLSMEYANASLYDGGTALYEAMMMAVRVSRRTRVVVSESVSPIYRRMLECYTSNLKLDLVTVPALGAGTDVSAVRNALNGETAALIVQNPDFFGSVHDFSELFTQAASMGILTILSVYPLLQSVLKTPGEMGADIAVAEGQSLGLPLQFGGPYLGILACNGKLVRQMPGRVAGKTVDASGRQGYVLTLQAREQHIRRHKATSNICSNQALCALHALTYCLLLGPEGMRRTAAICIERARYAIQKLTAIPGVTLENTSPCANEFTLRLPVSAFEALRRMAEQKYLPGFPLGRYYADMENCLLVACTEKSSLQRIGIMSELLRGVTT